ncbi:RagB/SusD family nutrient uptake outer membrane protein [Chitinophaga horti]|uniref:RagB/SusD family nutrient uptake outer membrane protein n=1 Tax=Chitinophaga horti TaxID=2920382 RepID=A0ABY6J2U0_9BACT|nr:RagB/SusD family nutrient uptake outer membrane protein [Chitinophaga horti]UYQ93979.1 RagB/SusD family nutrient uptake outer membrane protein [Chitinophaga horti]
MKQITYLLSTIILLSACTSLDENPPALLTGEQFYQTENDAKAAVNSVYTALNASGQTIYNSLFQIGVDIASDDALPGPRARNANVRALAALNYTPTNDRVEEIWKQHYAAINRANVAIDKIPGIDFDATIRTRLVNEAKFLRALYYFNLVRLYGAVPLVLHEPTTLGGDGILVVRTPEAEVYQQIIDDLEDASNLPPSYGASDAGRATGGAAKALLAKVYLTRKDWKKAAAKASEVITGPYGYDLFDNFQDVFNTATENGKEHIFSAQFKSNSNSRGNSLAGRSTPNGVPGINGDNADIPNEGVYALFRDTDKRKAVTFYTTLVSPTDNKTYTFAPQFGKYRDPAVYTNPSESGVNFPILRFSDVLLMYAEAVNEDVGPNTEAYNAANRVRKRAGLPYFENLSQSQFRDSIYLERRLEFVYEHQRWFDLIRTGKLLTELHRQGKPNAAQKHYLYPIPQREIDLNKKLEQQDLWKN